MAKRHGRPKAAYYWDGLQLPLTNLPTSPAQVVGILVDATAQEFMPSTLMRIRGHVNIVPTSTNADAGMLKIMYVETDDAGAMTGDHQAIDTHEEDIAVRQIWTYPFRSLGNGATNGQQVVTVEVDVKVKIKFEPSGKKKLVLLAQTGTTGRISIQAYLRCLLKHG